MLLLDVNILINAHRTNQPRHEEFKKWLEGLVSSNQPFSVPSIVRSGFIRIVTNPRTYSPPTLLEEALAFLNDLMVRPNFKEIHPGDRHWTIFTDLCRKIQAKGNLVADAYLAALAIECGGEWISADKDYARFPGLRWRHPLDTRYGPEGTRGPASAQEPRVRYRTRKQPALKALRK